MLVWLKTITDVFNLFLGCILIYTGFCIFTSLRISLRQAPTRFFVIAATLFIFHEIIFLLPVQNETTRIAHEVLQTGFISCLCLSMCAIARAQRSEINDLQRQTETDHLTELKNLAGFQRLALLAIKTAILERRKRAAEYSMPAVMMIDIDRFKNYNDEYGHDEGNIALQAVAQVIRQAARQDDLVGRYGGEEFIALMFLSPEDTLIAAERIRSQIETQCSIDHNPRLKRSLTVSIGVAVPTPHELALTPGELLNQLIKIADYELYRAKRTGRNRVNASLDV